MRGNLFLKKKVPPRPLQKNFYDGCWRILRVDSWAESRELRQPCRIEKFYPSRPSIYAGRSIIAPQMILQSFPSKNGCIGKEEIIFNLLIYNEII